MLLPNYKPLIKLSILIIFVFIEDFPLIIIKKGVNDSSFSSGVAHLDSVVPSGVLADVAPTILKIMGMSQPIEMKGISLF